MNKTHNDISTMSLHINEIIWISLNVVFAVDRKLQGSIVGEERMYLNISKEHIIHINTVTL